MAGLLYKNFLYVLCALVFFAKGAYAFDSSFPFPFEFGHSSDIYLDVEKNKTTKLERQQTQAATDLLKEKGIKTSPVDFVKYIKKNDIAAIKLLLNAGFDPNTNINANFPLYYSTKYNKKQITYLLLEKGANPNLDLTSPVRFAILNKDYDMVKMLIEYGANTNHTDTFTDETLLYTALKKKQYAIAALLIKNGAKSDSDSVMLIKKKNLQEKIAPFM